MRRDRDDLLKGTCSIAAKAAEAEDFVPQFEVLDRIANRINDPGGIDTNYRGPGPHSYSKSPIFVVDWIQSHRPGADAYLMGAWSRVRDGDFAK